MKAYFGSSSDSDTPAGGDGRKEIGRSGSLAAAWPPPGRGPWPVTYDPDCSFSNRIANFFFSTTAHAP